MYARLLGDRFPGLDEAIRLAHQGTEPFGAEGTFRITYGKGRLRRVIGLLARMPKPSEACAVRLTVVPDSNGERWTRVFDGRPLVTYQRPISGGLMAERFGALELWFRLTVDYGVLRYHQLHAALWCGNVRLPLPAWLAPIVDAVEEGSGPWRTHVRVHVRLPLFGTLIEYEGDVAKGVLC